MLIALTGATGFLGSHLVSRFLAQGADVVALVRDHGPSGRRRLGRALEATGSPLPRDWTRRVRLLATDLALPGLGLSTSDRRELGAAVDTWWHSAGLIDLVAPLPALVRVNVMGTRHFLDFVHHADARGHVVHVSTAYVAGGRLEGLVQERDLSDRHGFLTPYEQSKYLAEQLLRTWAHRHDRPVTVLRPSVLVTSRPRPPAAPCNPLSEIGARLSLLSRNHATWSAITGATGPLCFPGRPDATLNMLPVEHAAEVMSRLLGRVPFTHTDTFHITHPRNTPVQSILAAVRRLWPGLDIRLDPDCPRLGPVQQMLADITGGITAYSRLHRRYDTTLLDEALVPAPSPPPYLDTAYLCQALRPTAMRLAHTPKQESHVPPA